MITHEPIISSMQLGTLVVAVRGKLGLGRKNGEMLHWRGSWRRGPRSNGGVSEWRVPGAPNFPSAQQGLATATSPPILLAVSHDIEPEAESISASGEGAAQEHCPSMEDMPPLSSHH